MNQPLTARQKAQISQAQASDPEASAWVGASAGSGKTKVLTDRVLRLLLRDGEPGRILCLTFTKAAAAEMATRLNKELGRWAVADDDDLRAMLERLTGDEVSDALMARARRLFADVLDIPGGMRISTIHSFCQSLLRSFPLEAGIPPQFGVIEDSDANAMLSEAREAVLSSAFRILNRADALEDIAGVASPDDFTDVVDALVHDRQKLTEALRRLGGVDGLRTDLAGILGVAPDDDAEAVMAEAAIIPQGVIDAARVVIGKGEKGQKRLFGIASQLLNWSVLPEDVRRASWQDYCKILFTSEDEPRADLEKAPELDAEAQRIVELKERASACRLLKATSALLRLAHPVIESYEERKRSQGMLDYQDLIDGAKGVLKDPGAQWVLYKLDEGLDHVLLDEAQDTNPAQWSIASALAEDFFAGEGAREGRSRSIFAVGDIKQAIYGFQGADPSGFNRWRDFFQNRVYGTGGTFREVQLNVSFRSTAPVLGLVDAVFQEGSARMGVAEGTDEENPLRHLPDRGEHAGRVEIWPPLLATKATAAEPWIVPETPMGAAGPEALMAEAVAARIADMVAHERLPSRSEMGSPEGLGRRIRPGDIMVLVRRRTRFVQLLVRALKERGVETGGVDRLALVEQIAVQDVIALLDVLLLPSDDMRLACLLKSPLVGLSEDDLFAIAHPRPGRLWSALSAHRGADSDLGRAANWIYALLNRADYCTPHALLAEVLGEQRGRAKLLARLGPDASDPLDELLNAAIAFEKKYPPSLQGFLQWLRRGGAEVKREAEAGADAVRIMTVHGAKGLQAPIVFLPDVGSGRGDKAIRWEKRDGVSVPLWAPRGRKEFMPPAYLNLLGREDVARIEEENRLLYVALTRPEDRLVVCGWDPEPGDWYSLIAEGFQRLAGVQKEPFDPASFGAPEACNFGEGGLLALASPQRAEPVLERSKDSIEPDVDVPEWARRPAPAEAVADVIAPSAVPGETEPAAAAPGGTSDPGGKRFRRGRLIHALLQHLPDRPPATRREEAARFLARQGNDLDGVEQAEVLDEVMRLIEHPVASGAFAPGSLAEAPIAGEVDGVLIAGQVDRLLVSDDQVVVLDYKTNRPPPRTAAGVSPVYLRQLAAYRAVLQKAFPGRDVECCLVWTYSASVMEIPDTLLDDHAPTLKAAPSLVAAK